MTSLAPQTPPEEILARMIFEPGFAFRVRQNTAARRAFREDPDALTLYDALALVAAENGFPAFKGGDLPNGARQLYYEIARRPTPPARVLQLFPGQDQIPELPGDLIEDQLAESQALMLRDQSSGVRWTWPEVDRVMGPMLPGEIAVVGALSGNGKALALDTPLPTPTGWTTMGDVKEGDRLLDATGKPCRVVFVTPVQHGRECFTVRFGDGSTIVADADHLWVTRRRDVGQFVKGVRSTREILQTLRGGNAGARHCVRIAGAAKLRTRKLPLPPYALGIWLGDGTSTDAVVTMALEDAKEILPGLGVPFRSRSIAIGKTPGFGLGEAGGRGKRSGTVKGRLRDLGVLGNKHIPSQYLRASAPQRRDLLAGLIDSDGHITPGGQCEIVSVYPELAHNIHELALSLGYKATVSVDHARLNGRDYGLRYRIQFFPRPGACRLRRKAARIRAVKNPHRAQREWRHIVAIEPVASVPVRCVQVDSPSRTYLAGKSWIPTHNTSYLMGQMDALAMQGVPVLYVPLELDPAQCRLRWAAWRLGYAIDKVVRQDWSLLPAGAEASVSKLIDDQRVMTHIQFASPKRLTLEGLTKWCEWAKSTYGGRVVIVDHLHRLDAGGESRDRRVTVTDMVRRLKDMARDLSLQIIIAAQLNRTSDPLDSYAAPVAARIKESGAVFEEADTVLMLSRKLRRDLPKNWKLQLLTGQVNERDLEEPGLMVATCRKHRLDDSARDRRILLRVAGGRVESREVQRELAWQPPVPSALAGGDMAP